MGLLSKKLVFSFIILNLILKCQPLSVNKLDPSVKFVDNLREGYVIDGRLKYTPIFDNLWNAYTYFPPIDFTSRNLRKIYFCSNKPIYIVGKKSKKANILMRNTDQILTFALNKISMSTNLQFIYTKNQQKCVLSYKFAKRFHHKIKRKTISTQMYFGKRRVSFIETRMNRAKLLRSLTLTTLKFALNHILK